ncbi:MAG: hypothetical protein FJW95_10670 [Actinobacteria bacterium]|nr:hypothetical protein [Actinomycetota bacterium]
MSEDVEPNTEVELAGSEVAVAGDEETAEEIDAEKSVWRAVAWGTLIATPICIVIWCLIVVLAVGPEEPEDWAAWLGIGVIVGVLAGAFFGGWAGFIAKSHLLDEIDRSDARAGHAH